MFIMKDTIDNFYLDIKKTISECPWAKERTISDSLVELKKEVVEVNEALEKGDDVNLEEEIGDVFWDALFLLAIAEKEKGFDIKSLIKYSHDKLKRRKPWVFGNETVIDSDDAVRRWNEIKKEEKLNKL